MMNLPIAKGLLWTAGLAAVLFSGCRKAEEPMVAEWVDTIDLADLYGNRVAVVSIGEDYTYQAYYNLGLDSLVGMYDKYSWDIALTHDDPPRLWLNSSIPGLRVAEAGVNWGETVGTEGLEWRYDLPGRRLEDLALGNDWNQVLVLDRGLDAAGNSRGFKQFLLVEEGAGWVLRVANLDGTGAQSFAAERDEAYNRTSWSLDAGAVIAEPPRDDWDLLFTSYLTLVADGGDPFPYQVTGALLNPAGGQAARLEDTPYASVTQAADWIPALVPQADAIGYDWKTYDFITGYAMVPDLTFVVACRDGVRALAFTGFVNESGEPGSCAFIHRRLP
jgi:hypothetical protein